MTPANQPSSAASSLLGIFAGAWLAQAVHVAAKLGLADRVGGGRMTVSALAAATSTHPAALGRLLRALVSVGIFDADDDGRIGPTPLSSCLRADAPGSLRAFALMLGEPAHWRAWEGLAHSVRTGAPAFDAVFGMTHFEYFARHPEPAGS